MNPHKSPRANHRPEIPRDKPRHAGQAFPSIRLRHVAFHPFNHRRRILKPVRVVADAGFVDHADLTAQLAVAFPDKPPMVIYFAFLCFASSERSPEWSMVAEKPRKLFAMKSILEDSDPSTMANAFPPQWSRHPLVRTSRQSAKVMRGGDTAAGLRTVSAEMWMSLESRKNNALRASGFVIVKRR